MKQLLILTALLTLSACAAGPRCGSRLIPINASRSPAVAAGSAHQVAPRGAAQGGRP